MSSETDPEAVFEFPEARTPAERFGEALSLRFGRVSWTPPEIVPTTIIAAVLLFAIGQIAAGVVIGVTPEFSGVGTAIRDATDWAEPILAALLLGSVFLSWNQVSSCCDELDLYDSSDDQVANEIDPDETVARLWRSWFLASSAFVTAAVTLAAAIATEVGVAMQGLPRQVNGILEGALDAETWGALIASGASALSVAVLALACLAIVLRIRRRASATLCTPEPETADPQGFMGE